MKTIVIATKNQNKILEFQSLFSSVNVVGLNDDENIIEDGMTFKENAFIKAQTIALKYQMTVLADDSGLVVEALGGEPGVHSARYAEEHNDAKNNEKLIANLKNSSNRNASFVCALCVYHPDGTYLMIEEKCDGIIIDESRGTNGFGYDPHFYIPSCQKTFAQMTLEEKNQYSHRSKAIRKLKELCNEDLSFK